MAIKGKKKWVSIVSSDKNFKDAVIGETLCNNVQELKGKKVEVNLMSLNNDPRSQSIKLIFKIHDIKDDEPVADVIGYELLQSYLKRISRKDVNKIDDSHKYKTKDNIDIVVKLILITKNKTNKSVLSLIRKNLRNFLTEEIKKQDYTVLMNNIFKKGLPKSLRMTLSKVYPIIVCEFRVVKRI